MTKKPKHKLQKSQKIEKDNNSSVSYIDQLPQKIAHSGDFFVIAKEAGYFVVGTIVPLKVRVEKSGNIFQPFGKNIMKNFPVYFPLVFDPLEANNAEIVYGFNEYEIPILYLSKEQLHLNQYEIVEILCDYLGKAF